MQDKYFFGIDGRLTEESEREYWAKRQVEWDLVWDEFWLSLKEKVSEHLLNSLNNPK